MTPHVELIYDVDCPNVAEAREVLSQAFKLVGISPSWTEWDRKASGSPTYVRGYGSPTILMDGEDVADGEPIAKADCCRLYSGGEKRFRGAPTVEQIAAALTKGGVERVEGRTAANVGTAYFKSELV